MTTEGIIRKDFNGHIISKNDKNYHISFNQKVDVIKIESYKKWNLITSGADIEDFFFGDNGNNYEENKDPNKKLFIDGYNIKKKRKYSNRNPQALSRIKCVII